MKKIRNLALRLAILATPIISFAQPTTNVTGNIPTVEGKNITDFTAGSLWTRVIVWVNWIVALVGIVSVILLLYGAVMYMTAGQNEEHLKKAKNSVVYGIIGAVVAVLSFSIFSFAKSLMSV
jgi:hypothetical protein